MPFEITEKPSMEDRTLFVAKVSPSIYEVVTTSWGVDRCPQRR